MIYKKIISRIMNNIDLDINLNKFVDNTFSLYNRYSTIKMSMNLFTFKEVIEEKSDTKSMCFDYYNILFPLIEKVMSGKYDSDIYEDISNLRNKIINNMTLLTSYTDAFEVYEYILNRKEAALLGTIAKVDTVALSDEMFDFVFQDKEKVHINSKIQLLVAQLPIRMTKNRFYDLVSNTLMLYKGGEEGVAEDYCNMIRSMMDFSIITNQKNEYSNLYEVYKLLNNQDYKNLSKENFLELTNALQDATTYLSFEVSDCMLLQEIINDLLVICLSNIINENNIVNDKSMEAAKTIIKDVLKEKSIEEIMEEDKSSFDDILGAQEEIYSELVGYESSIFDINKEKHIEIIENNLKDSFENLIKCNSLVSSSLFIDLDENRNKSNIADSVFIANQQQQLISDIKRIFEQYNIDVVRSFMSKVIGMMPVFFNSQQEVKDYFISTLEKCSDASELTACAQVIREILY